MKLLRVERAVRERGRCVARGRARHARKEPKASVALRGGEVNFSPLSLQHDVTTRSPENFQRLWPGTARFIAEAECSGKFRSRIRYYQRAVGDRSRSGIFRVWRKILAVGDSQTNSRCRFGEARTSQRAHAGCRGYERGRCLMLQEAVSLRRSGDCGAAVWGCRCVAFSRWVAFTRRGACG